MPLLKSMRFCGRKLMMKKSPSINIILGCFAWESVMALSGQLRPSARNNRI